MTQTHELINQLYMPDSTSGFATSGFTPNQKLLSEINKRPIGPDRSAYLRNQFFRLPEARRMKLETFTYPSSYPFSFNNMTDNLPLGNRRKHETMSDQPFKDSGRIPAKAVTKNLTYRQIYAIFDEALEVSGHTADEVQNAVQTRIDRMGQANNILFPQVLTDISSDVSYIRDSHKKSGPSPLEEALKEAGLSIDQLTNGLRLPNSSDISQIDELRRCVQRYYDLKEIFVCIDVYTVLRTVFGLTQAEITP